MGVSQVKSLDPVLEEKKESPKTFFYVSVNSNWVHLTGQPPGVCSKKFPWWSAFDFWKLPGGRLFNKGRDFVESLNYTKHH